mgnify:CR=1 FL=1
MILTNELETVNSINEAWLQEALQREATAINKHTDTYVEVYNSRPNHFTIVVDDSLEYMLDITGYTAELMDCDSTFNDKNILLVAIIDDSDNFEDELATEVISAVYKTL